MLERSSEAKGLRHWASLSPLCPCGRLSRPQTTPPFPPPLEALEFRWGLPYLLPTLLNILQEASRVRNVGLIRDGLGGVFLAAPSALCGSPAIHRVSQVYLCSLLERCITPLNRFLFVSTRYTFGFAG